jgi:PhnB protein
VLDELELARIPQGLGRVCYARGHAGSFSGLIDSNDHAEGLTYDSLMLPRTVVESSIAPWLSVRDGARAVEFYKTAFGAKEVFRLEGASVVARLTIGNSEFWVSEESPEHGNFSPETLKGSSTRFVLTVADPDSVFKGACTAGAQPIHPVAEEHGWRVGRVVDPFGHRWEIGRPVSSSDS